MFTCVGGEERRKKKKGARGLKMRKLTLSMGPARVEVCSFVQKTIIGSKRVFFLHS
jgi:hypothetical protein